MIIAFSTCWNSARHRHGEEMLEEIVDLGFRAVELSHGIRLSLVDGIQRFVSERSIEVTSLHNFCPLPIDILQAAPDCFQCTSHRSNERARATRHTLETIDLAARIGVKRVVLHLGSVPMGKESNRLIDHLHRGKASDRTFVHRKTKALKKRGKLDYYPRVAEWLNKIAERAAQTGVQLGVENRIGIDTFPSEQEFRRLFQDFSPEVVGYWHDFGHAQIRHYLTLSDHRSWLEEMLPRLFGCHVHDVKFPDRDHQVPFSGEIAFAELIPLIPPGTPLVWELSSSATAPEIKVALERWRTLFKKNDQPARDRD
jgi:sugar phosphate isomerase/epimerase